MAESLIIPYQASDTDTTGEKEPFVHLIQDGISSSNNKLTDADLQAMLNLAIEGKSAKTYIPDNCPITIKDGSLEGKLEFYAFPSAPDLEYDMTLSFGEASEAVREDVPKELEVIFGLTDSVDLEFYPSDLTWEWQSEAYNEYGEVIDKPEITHDGCTLKSDVSFFGVLRVTATAIADYYEITLTVQKEYRGDDAEIPQECIDDCLAAWQYLTTDYDECVQQCQDEANKESPPDRTTYKVENFACTVQVGWQGLEEWKTESMDLEVPDCFKELMEFCEDGDLMAGGGWGLAPIKIVVYYSTCTGYVQLVRKEAA